MATRIIGAGLPRTGTTSLKAAIEQLTGEPCYHMFELFGRIETDGARWFNALHGDLTDLHAVLDAWPHAVDWPAALMWRELMEADPEAMVLLSHRGSAEEWWNSADRTVWAMMRRTDQDLGSPTQLFNVAMRTKAGLGDEWNNPDAMKAMYDQHYADVIETVPAERLVLWQPGDGWEPLCAALGVTVPDMPFPHRNPRDEFREMAGLNPQE